MTAPGPLPAERHADFGAVCAAHPAHYVLLFSFAPGALPDVETSIEALVVVPRERRALSGAMVPQEPLFWQHGDVVEIAALRPRTGET